MDNSIVLVGNTTRDVELRQTAGGTSVGNFGLAVNYRKKAGDGYEDVPSFFDVTVWDSLADNVADSCPKGTRVVVVGRLEQQSWETDGGDKRSKLVVIADSVAPDLRWATASVTRNEKGNGRQVQRQPARSAARPSRPAAPSYDAEESF